MANSAVVLTTNFQHAGKCKESATVNTDSITITGTAFANKVQLSGEVSGCDNADFFTLSATVDINSANNIRFYLFGLISTGGTEYLIYNEAQNQEYFEVTLDADHSVSAHWVVNKRYPIYKVYGIMGTDGGTDPAITSSYVTVGIR